MMPILQTAATGVSAQGLKIDAIANNLANIDTAAFKRTRIGLRDVSYVPASLLDPAALEEDKLVGLGVQAARSELLFDQGPMQYTGNPLDLAIIGEGFFQVQMADGSTGYVRGGSFNLDGARQLVDESGRILLPGLIVPEDAVAFSIKKDGEVTALRAGEAEPEVLGRIELARFPNPAGLLAVGKGAFKATAASGAATVGDPGTAGYGDLLSGALEGSNVDMAEEMTGLVQALRAYQVTLKVVKGLDDLLALAVSQSASGT